MRKGQSPAATARTINAKEVGTLPAWSNLCTLQLALSTAVWSRVTRTERKTSCWKLKQKIVYLTVRAQLHLPLQITPALCKWFLQSNPVNMPDPIRIRSGSSRKHWPCHWLASGPDPFGQNLTQSASTKPDPGWFYTVWYPGRLWVNGTESESRKLVAGRMRHAKNQARWFLHTSLLLDQMRLAKPWPGHSDQIRVGFAQYDHAFFGKTELKRMREVGFGIYYPARFWLRAGRNGSNWP